MSTPTPPSIPLQQVVSPNVPPPQLVTPPTMLVMSPLFGWGGATALGVLVAPPVVTITAPVTVPSVITPPVIEVAPPVAPPVAEIFGAYRSQALPAPAGSGSPNLTGSPLAVAPPLVIQPLQLTPPVITAWPPSVPTIVVVPFTYPMFR